MELVPSGNNQLSLSGSDVDSDTAEEEEPGCGVRRADQRRRAERESGAPAPAIARTIAGGVAGAKPGKKTRGRVKIKMEFIDNKLRRYTTFSKRKTGIMKKAYELSTLTGTQVLLLVASETGHVYTFATRKLQPMITSETGKALIQTCLNSPDSPRSDSATDQRMSATGFEETDITYQVTESDGSIEVKEVNKPAGTSIMSSSIETPSTSSALSVRTDISPPATTCWSVSNGTLVKTSTSAAGVVQLPAGFTLVPGTAVSQSTEGSEVQNFSSGSGTHSALIASSIAGHVICPSAVMCANSASTLTDHTLAHDALPQMFLRSPNGTVQIPVSAVPLHSPLPSYDDQNFHVVCVDGRDFVLKVINSIDSKNMKLLELQTHTMNFLRQNGLPVQTALCTVTGELMSLEEIDCGFGLQKYLVRLLTYLPGTPIAKVTCTPQLLYEMGKTAATIDQILLRLEHENLGVLQRKNFVWNLCSVPLIEDYLYVMDGEPMQLIIKEVLNQYQNQVVPKLPSFRKCVNHGDLNNMNTLVGQIGSSGYRISGILDFGDMSSGYFIFELAIVIVHMMMESPNPLEVGGPVIAGFERVFPLNADERDALYTLVLCRFSQALVYTRSAVLQQPENEEYLVYMVKNGIKLLQLLWEKGKEQVEKVWFEGAVKISMQTAN
ncbi:Hydroxylysine kinase [Bagarius yarrelli]|uniref:Hydroxylysine kinase n=1 Tax=Bagarius yarrelli TaxID=175774 RepID=A0A556TSD9_BAGYA|nr:Hydroxylysine kinase [Bagarius yarrelli]